MNIPTSQVWSLAVEARRSGLYAAFAAARGMTLPDYRAEMDAKVADLVRDRAVRVRVRAKDLPSILADGRLKNQFETNTSGGALNAPGRIQVEERMFGLSPATPGVDRPKYGYLEGSSEIAMVQYGTIVIEMQPGVTARTTFTLGDTLDHTFFASVPTMAPTPLQQPSDAAAHTDFDVLDGQSLPQLAGFGAAECQIHGGITVSDFARVVFTQGGSPESGVEVSLDAAQIQWETMQGETP